MVQATPEVNTCPPEHKHAATTTCKISHKCQCAPCGEAIRLRQSAWRRQRAYGQPAARSLIPATGTRRRLQALGARGWSLAAIGRELGMTTQAVFQFSHRQQVQRKTAEKIAALYDRLWSTEPPAETLADRIARAEAKNHAARKGHPPPAAWDDIDHDPEPPVTDEGRIAFDHAVVELAVMGHKPTLTTDEREEVVRRLHSRRWSDNTIAEHIGGFGETVLRTRQRLGLAAWPKAELLWHEKNAA